MGTRDDRNEAELQEGDGLVRTTVVGGQPRKRPTIRMSIRVGLERVLYRAAVDRAFREAFLKDREGALQAAGMELSAGESAVLSSVDGDALATMIDNVKPEDRREHRFVKAVAATFVTLATGTASCNVWESQSAGIQPDDMVGVDVTEPGADHGNVEVDVSEPYPDEGISSKDALVDIDAMVTQGIQPDHGYLDTLAEPVISAGIPPDEDVFVEADVDHGTPAGGGIQPGEDVPEGEEVEVEVTNPFDGGSAADSGKSPYPRKPRK